MSLSPAFVAGNEVGLKIMAVDKKNYLIALGT